MNETVEQVNRYNDLTARLSEAEAEPPAEHPVQRRRQVSWVKALHRERDRLWFKMNDFVPPRKRPKK